MIFNTGYLYLEKLNEDKEIYVEKYQKKSYYLQFRGIKIQRIYLIIMLKVSLQNLLI